MHCNILSDLSQGQNDRFSEKNQEIFLKFFSGDETKTRVDASYSMIEALKCIGLTEILEKYAAMAYNGNVKPNRKAS